MGFRAPPVFAPVVEALQEEDYIRERIVGREDNLRFASVPVWPFCGISIWRTIVGRTPCITAPTMLNTSPTSHTIKNDSERPSADPRLNW